MFYLNSIFDISCNPACRAYVVYYAQYNVIIRWRMDQHCKHIKSILQMDHINSINWNISFKLFWILLYHHGSPENISAINWVRCLSRDSVWGLPIQRSRYRFRITQFWLRHYFNGYDGGVAFGAIAVWRKWLKKDSCLYISWLLTSIHGDWWICFDFRRPQTRYQMVFDIFFVLSVLFYLLLFARYLDMTALEVFRVQRSDIYFLIWD